MSSSAIKSCLLQLSNDRTYPTAEQITEAMTEIMTGKATPAQIGAYLLALQIAPLPASHILVASAAVLRSLCPVAPDLCQREKAVLDIVGTGGDSWDTFNVSTASAIVLASMGVTCPKHGNRSSSGRCGSADFAEALGASLASTPEQIKHCLKESNFTFLFAQRIHPSMAAIAPIRKELGVRSIFNMLGPLLNPMLPSHLVLGVGTKSYGPLYAQVLSETAYVSKALVLHAEVGLDEIAPIGKTFVWEVSRDVDGKAQVREYTVSPADFGLPEHSMEEVAGASPAENVEMFRKIIKGEKGALRDFLLINASAALVLVGKATNFIEGVQMVSEALDSGQVENTVAKYIETSLQHS